MANGTCSLFIHRSLTRVDLGRIRTPNDVLLLFGTPLEKLSLLQTFSHFPPDEVFVSVTLSEEKCQTGVCTQGKLDSPDDDRSITEGGGAAEGTDNCGVYLRLGRGTGVHLETRVHGNHWSHWRGGSARGSLRT